MKNDARLAELQHRIAELEDINAYEELFLSFASALIRFSKSIVHNKEEAEEIVSDVFMRIWDNRKNLDHIHNLRYYLYAATRNFSINRLKSSKRNATIALEEMDMDPDNHEASPADMAISSDLFRIFQEAVNELPPRCRIIFKLTKEDGLKQKEVAELLHISIKTVENQLAIALFKLSQRIQLFDPAIQKNKS